MRIIDKNTDFYDYYQNVYKDDTFTFDRRNSFVLTKEIMCSYLPISSYWSWKLRKKTYATHTYALLQICNTYWLFLIKITERDSLGRAKDYEVEFLMKWRNFDKPRKLCNLEIIDFYYHKVKKDSYNKINDYVKNIDINNYEIIRTINKHIVFNGAEKVIKNIPLLKACGIGNCMDAHETYLAFEEYFSLEKTSQERRDPIGTTDIDKIESHGFDKKTSFRGKI